MVRYKDVVVLGIVGGIASGKSLVAEEFERLGAARIQADQLGHEVLREAAVKQQLRSRWGAGIFRSDGEIDRSQVARIVFASPPHGPRERAFLEQVTHPRIGAAIRQGIDQRRQAGDVPAVVLDAAVLLEAGWHGMCDQIIFVETSPSLRRVRAAQRGWDDQQFAAREAAQLDLEDKRRRAHFVIDNNRSPAETAAQVRAIWRQIVQTQPPSSDCPFPLTD
jgi:dephospho-CoA kinase